MCNPLKVISTYILKGLNEGVMIYQLPLLKFQELKHLREFLINNSPSNWKAPCSYTPQSPNPYYSTKAKSKLQNKDITSKGTKQIMHGRFLFFLVLTSVLA